MKQLTPSARRRAASGFTLIEIMVVIMIIGLLATLSILAMRHVNTVANRKKTEGYLIALELAIDRYQQENGSIPRPKEGSSGEMATVSGKDYPVGGAITLYQAVTADGDDAIEGGDTASQGRAGSMPESIVYWADADPSSATRVTREANGKWYIADGFGAPFQYRVPPIFDPKKPDAFEQAKGQYHNPRGYDLWSFGGDLPGSTDDKGWIKNW